LLVQAVHDHLLSETMIAIHDRRFYGSFNAGWIEYCIENSIPFKSVNCYDSDIVAQVRDCDALLWHHSHVFYEDVLFAKQLLYSLEQAGKRVYPDFNTTWHFDDKVGQKYLLESIGAPLVPSYVFYSKSAAVDWIQGTSFPKVFKLRIGAGGMHVKLVASREQASALVKRAFTSGFSRYDEWHNLKERLRRYRSGSDSVYGIFKGVVRLLLRPAFVRMQSSEKGYAYFQDFIADNESDTRIVVVGDRALGEKRLVRENDFRASGSGKFVYSNIDLEAVGIAFDVSRRLKLQSAAFDFVFDSHRRPLIVEMSYGFGTTGICNAPGYWTSDLRWHEGRVNPEGWILEGIMRDFGGVRSSL